MSRTEESYSGERRRFLAGIGAAGLVTASTMLVGCGGGSSRASTNMDSTIINAAATAEALATVMYDNLIKSSLNTSGLNGNVNDQAYLTAGREQEYLHYQTLVAAGGVPLATTFYFPVGMFTTANGTQSVQTAINTLITLEDAFIAAYLIGVRDFSTSALKVLAGQIAGVESEHRVLGRIIAADLGLSSVTGLSGTAEGVQGSAGHASNNIAYERTFTTTGPSFQNISSVVAALGPFVTPPSAGAAGAYDPTPYALNTTANYYLTETPVITLDSTTP